MSDVRAGAIVYNIAHSCTLPRGVLLMGISRGEDANGDGHADIQRRPYVSRYAAGSAADCLLPRAPRIRLAAPDRARFDALRRASFPTATRIHEAAKHDRRISHESHRPQSRR